MKKILITLAILAITAGPALAAEQETLIKGDHEHGGFGGPVVKITTFDFEPGIVVGGRGGWIIDHKLVIGGGGYGLTKNLNKGEDDISDGSTLSFGYGGFELEYIFGSDKLVHGSIYTLIGGGSLSLMGDETDNHTIETNEYFVFEPDLNLELNVTKFFRIGLGVGYRFVAGDDFLDYDYLDLSGVTGTLTFKFGKF